MASIMQSIADSPAPILESLRLLHQSRMASYVLLPDLFAGHSPRLRQLELLQIQIPWSAPILRSLQHLKIKFPWSEPTPGNIPIPECYSQFFMALKEMADLRTLYLAYCLPSQSGQVEAELSTNLPFLETLSLYSEDAGGCVGVLKHITFPQSCRVLVGCDDFSPGHVGEMRDLVKAHTGTNTDRPPPLTIFISITDDDEPVYIINVWRTAHSPSPVDICPEPDFSLRVSRPNTDELIMTRIAALLRNLWIESISALVVGAGGISWGPFEWIDVFQPYTGLESVRAHKYAALSFCDALRMPISKVEIDQSEDDNTEENLLTKKTLFLDKLKFVELRTVDFSSAYDDEEDDVFHEELKTWLIERKEAAGMLPTFAIRDCSISPDKVKELEEMTEIDWDLVEHMQDIE
ncbi:hypothetical protein EWM64_g3609 [Hericium alpestre]|uniref:F-box domain-containing protein n=1 Tax=Hericium alpestre TaxID=135208 RepID=A0A4Z0A139_9AGAM|nr:hypothetical protein EWM64_g3609 [Hericium alpestre]